MLISFSVFQVLGGFKRIFSLFVWQGCVKNTEIHEKLCDFILLGHPGTHPSQSSITLGCSANSFERFFCSTLVCLDSCLWWVPFHSGGWEAFNSPLVSFTHKKRRETPDLWNNLSFLKHKFCSLGAFFLCYKLKHQCSKSMAGHDLKSLPPIKCHVLKATPPKIKAFSLRHFFCHIGKLFIQIPLKSFECQMITRIS